MSSIIANLKKSVVLLIFISTITGCATKNRIIYFQDIQNTKGADLDGAIGYSEPLIQPDDNLSINIFTLNQQTGAIINQAASTPILGGNANSAVSQQVTGFVVDKNGDIELALAGKIKVAGLTTFEARETIKERVAQFYNTPNVQLRFANFKVSVLGEVNAPSTYNMPNEKVTIMDALSLAGDLTVFGRRDNILIVRDNNGKKHYEHVDLNSSGIFNNPYYYLRQNDLVYVEPTKSKNLANSASKVQTIGIVTSVLSVLILAVSVLK